MKWARSSRRRYAIDRPQPPTRLVQRLQAVARHSTSLTVSNRFTEALDAGWPTPAIGLPAKLLYGTDILPCILRIDTRDVVGRKGVFMIDASKDFAKDGPKHCLCE